MMSGYQALNCSFQLTLASWIFVAIASNALAQTATSTTKDQSSLTTRQTIQRSLPFIEKGGDDWITNQKCITCHQVPYMVWSLNAAENLGLKLDKPGLARANQWSTQWINLAKVNSRDTATEKETLLSENDTIAPLLLGRNKSKDVQESSRWIETYRTHLIQSQQKNGSWKPGGQLPEQKRTLRETTEVSTMWALLGIATSEAGLSKDAEYVLRAKKWLESDFAAGNSTEWWAVRLMLERTLGNDQLADEIRQALLKRQRDDGGWGWLCDESSDALGTGIAIYALSRDGMDTQSRPLIDATQFLSSTQNKDGSWSVKGTKEGDREHHAKTASYWGTCWAVIGLIESLSEESEYQ